MCGRRETKKSWVIVRFRVLSYRGREDRRCEVFDIVGNRRSSIRVSAIWKETASRLVDIHNRLFSKFWIWGLYLKTIRGTWIILISMNISEISNWVELADNKDTWWLNPEVLLYSLNYLIFFQAFICVYAVWWTCFPSYFLYIISYIYIQPRKHKWEKAYSIVILQLV